VNKGCVVLVILITLMAFLAGCQQRPSNTSPASPGLEPYTPTKLEWLWVELNSDLAEVQPCYSTYFTKREL
jgi:hypothetical protein